MKKLKVVNNSPVVLWFTLICTLALVLNMITRGISNVYLFSVTRASFRNPLTYIRFFTHVFGHADMSHYLGNMTLFVVIGPMLEEKHGSQNMLMIMTITAFVTGLVHFILFPGTILLGASGIVFACILLSSFTKYKEGTIPITFIIVFVIYIGEQIYEGMYLADNVSNLTHILGGVVGAIFGAKFNKRG